MEATSITDLWRDFVKNTQRPVLVCEIISPIISQYIHKNVSIDILIILFIRQVQIKFSKLGELLAVYHFISFQ